MRKNKDVCVCIILKYGLLLASITEAILQALHFFVVVLCTSYTVLHYYLQLCYTLYIHLIIAYCFDLDFTVIWFL